MLGEDGVGVGTDGVEGDVAEVEQPRVADDDVQAEAEQDVDKREGHDVDRAARAKDGNEEGSHDQERQHPAAMVFDKFRRTEGIGARRAAAQAVFHLDGERQQQLHDEDDDGGIDAVLPLAAQAEALRTLVQMHAEDGQGDEEGEYGGNDRIKQVAHQTFSTSGLPRIPDGRMSRTTISREKATRSLYSLAR